jgi:hypothetical protein
MKAFVIALSVLASVVSIGYTLYLSNASPDDIKRTCRTQMWDPFYTNQYNDCLARELAKTGKRI